MVYELCSEVYRQHFHAGNLSDSSPPHNCFVFAYLPLLDNFVYGFCPLSGIVKATQWSRNWICSHPLGQKWRSTSSVAPDWNTWYTFPKLCVVFITLGLRQSPEMQQNSAVRVPQNWRVYLYKFTSSIFSPDVNIKCLEQTTSKCYKDIILTHKYYYH